MTGIFCYFCLNFDLPGCVCSRLANKFLGYPLHKLEGVNCWLWVLHDGVEGGSGNSTPNEVGLEEDLGAAEALATNGQNLTIRKLVLAIDICRLRGVLHLFIKVESDEGELLLDVTRSHARRWW